MQVIEWYAVLARLMLSMYMPVHKQCCTTNPDGQQQHKEKTPRSNLDGGILQQMQHSSWCSSTICASSRLAECSAAVQTDLNVEVAPEGRVLDLVMISNTQTLALAEAASFDLGRPILQQGEAAQMSRLRQGQQAGIWVV